MPLSSSDPCCAHPHGAVVPQHRATASDHFTPGSSPGFRSPTARSAVIHHVAIAPIAAAFLNT